MDTAADQKKMNALPLSQWLASSRPDHIVVAQRVDQTIRLADLRRDVTALQSQLATRPELRWALCFHDSYPFCVALLAMLYAAKIPVLLGHNRQAQLAEQSRHFDAVLTDVSLRLSCPVWQINHSVDTPPSGLLPPLSKSATITLFTSGSTGEPQAVNKSIETMDRESAWLAKLWGPRLNDCLVRASVSHQHLYGLTFRIWLPLALGLPFECAQVDYPEQLVNNRRCAFVTSPAFLRRLDQQLPAPPCSFVLSAGGPLSFAEAQRAQGWLGVAPDEIYGCTETGVIAWRSRHQQQTLWCPFPGVRFRHDQPESWRVLSPLIADPQGVVLDDQLVFNTQGQFSLTGRRECIVKIEEKRISLSEIEQRLLALEEIFDAAVLIIQRGSRQRIGAVVVLNPSGLQALQQVGWLALTQRWRQQLAGWLEPIAIPRYWRVVAEIQLNQHSKRSWPQLQALFHETR